MNAALARAFKCPSHKNGKHFMYLIRPVEKWRTFKCDGCGYMFRPGEGSDI